MYDFQQYHNQLMMLELTEKSIEKHFFSFLFFSSIFLTSVVSLINSVNCVGGVGAKSRSIIVSKEIHKETILFVVARSSFCLWLDDK